MRKAIWVVVALLVAMPDVAKDKNKSIEQYKANAIMQTGGGSSIAEINIYRWSTDEERNEILEVIKKATAENRINSRDVAKALRGQKKAGYAFFAQRQGYPLRYSRSFDMGDGKRQIILATDRPVSFGEVYNQSRLGDFDVSLILLFNELLKMLTVNSVLIPLLLEYENSQKVYDKPITGIVMKSPKRFLQKQRYFC